MLILFLFPLLLCALYHKHQVAMVEEEEEGITTHHEIHQLLNMNQVEDGVVVEDMYREEGKSVLLTIILRRP